MVAKGCAADHRDQRTGAGDGFSTILLPDEARAIETVHQEWLLRMGYTLTVQTDDMLGPGRCAATAQWRAASCLRPCAVRGSAGW